MEGMLLKLRKEKILIKGEYEMKTWCFNVTMTLKNLHFTISLCSTSNFVRESFRYRNFSKAKLKYHEKINIIFHVVRLMKSFDIRVEDLFK